MKESHWKHCNKKIYKEHLEGYKIRLVAIIEGRAFFCPICGERLEAEHYRFE